MNAPIVGTHLPTLKEMIAATMVNQMNTRTNSTSRSDAPPRNDFGTRQRAAIVEELLDSRQRSDA